MSKLLHIAKKVAGYCIKLGTAVGGLLDLIGLFAPIATVVKWAVTASAAVLGGIIGGVRAYVESMRRELQEQPEPARVHHHHHHRDTNTQRIFLRLEATPASNDVIFNDREAENIAYRPLFSEPRLTRSKSHDHLYVIESKRCRR